MRKGLISVEIDYFVEDDCQESDEVVQLESQPNSQVTEILTHMPSNSESSRVQCEQVRYGVNTLITHCLLVYQLVSPLGNKAGNEQVS